MEIYRSLDQLPSLEGRAVGMTLGAFDGIHRGHRSIIAQVVDCARRDGGPAVLLTFDPHPGEVLSGGNGPFLLTSFDEKVEALEPTGLDILAAIPFTVSFAAMPAETFIREILIGKFHASCIIAGYDMAFGHNREGNRALLHLFEKEYGFRVVNVPPVEVGGDIISSTLIRAHLRAGRVEDAAELLGRPYRVTGEVYRDQELAAKLGAPTANMATGPKKLLPADGVYAGWATHNGERFPAAISVGMRPTVPGAGRALEAHLIKTRRDLYGETLRVDFTARLRGQVKFDGVEALAAQIQKDIALVEKTLLG